VDSSGDNALRGFHAEYVASYMAFKADVSMTLAKTNEPDEYLYRVETTARGLASLVRPGTGKETSRLRAAEGELQSLSYALDDGTDEVENDTTISFDYEAGLVHSIYKGEPVDIEVTPGLVDRLAADIIAINELRNDISPDGSEVVIRNSVRRYDLIPQGKETVTVEAGTFDTVVYLRQHPGSSRSAKIWYAPAADYLPVKIEQIKRGKTQVVAEAVLLKPGN